MKGLTIYDYQVVHELPEEDIVSTRCYIWTEDPDRPEEILGVPYVWWNDEWQRLSISRSLLESFVKQNHLEENYFLKKNYQLHSNIKVLDKFTESEDGVLKYDNQDIRQIFVSEDYNNAVELRDGRLFVKDYSQVIHDLQIGAAFSTDILYGKECNDSGLYDLEYSIDEFSMLLIDYYYKPHDETLGPGCAKSTMISVSTLNELYSKGIDYMLELGYGISSANSKIRMTDDKLYVNYYHNVCIYKITGIRKSGGEE